jgi:ribokinase
MTIAVFGSINMDITAYSERLPRPGETLHGSRYLTGLGGKGANQAAAAAKLGAETYFVGRLGRDHFGTSALALLQAFGVETGHLKSDPENPTGIAIINVDGKGENFITVIAGANFAIDASDVETARPLLSRISVLLLQLEVPWNAMMLAARHARGHGATVILDPAPAGSDTSQVDLSLVDIVTPNEIETEILTGIRPKDRERAAAAAHILHARGPSAVILKLGDRGAYVSAGGEATTLKAFKVDAIDTVAAGDCFNGGLAFALSKSMPLREAARFACACGALSTTRYGAAAAAPSLPEVNALLSKG